MYNIRVSILYELSKTIRGYITAIQSTVQRELTVCYVNTERGIWRELGGEAGNCQS